MKGTNHQAHAVNIVAVGDLKQGVKTSAAKIWVSFSRNIPALASEGKNKNV